MLYGKFCGYPLPAVYCISRYKLPAGKTAYMKGKNFPAAERIAYNAFFAVVTLVKLLNFFKYHTIEYDLVICGIPRRR